MMKLHTVNWEHIFEQHGRALLLFARQWAPSTADAEDLVQEGFLKVYNAKEPIASERVVPALYNAIRWSGLDRIRSAQRREKREVFAHVAEPEESLFETTMETDERRVALESALHTLPDEQREVVVMKVWGDRTFREIASILEIPLNTAASRYRYALEALRNHLHPELAHG